MVNNHTLKIAALTYDVIRAAKVENQELPTWQNVHQDKQAMLANAVDAATNGAEVWEVWAFYCGGEPDINTREVFSRQPDVLKRIPYIITAFGYALSEAQKKKNNSTDTSAVVEVEREATESDLPPEEETPEPAKKNPTKKKSTKKKTTQ